jgi:delta-aminolevulinic acid dehydratase/porphobilinogen synthase
MTLESEKPGLGPRGACVYGGSQEKAAAIEALTSITEADADTIIAQRAEQAADCMGETS